MLLDVGAAVERADSSGWRPLHIAAYRGHESVVRELLRRGADPSAYTERWLRSSYGDSDRDTTPSSWRYCVQWRGQPLHLAAFRRHPAVVEALLDDERVDVDACVHHVRPHFEGSDDSTREMEYEETRQSAISLILHTQDSDDSSVEENTDEPARSKEMDAVVELLRAHGGSVVRENMRVPRASIDEMRLIEGVEVVSDVESETQ